MEEMSTHETINKEDGSLIYHKASSLRKRNRSDPPHKERKDEDRRRRHIFRLGIDFFVVDDIALVIWSEHSLCIYI